MLQVGSRVLIRATAFGDSQEPEDMMARGKVGEIVVSLEQQFNEQWRDCWEVQLDDSGDIVRVVTDELDELDE